MKRFLLLALSIFHIAFSEELDAVFVGNPICAPLFTAENDLKETLIKLIDEEKKSIKMAIYFLTDSIIASALARAVTRGIKVTIITDHSNTKNMRYTKIPKLHKDNVPVFVYGGNGIESEKDGIMHHKFFIFKENFEGRTIVWTGSFNCTYSAQRKNMENAVIISSKIVAKTYAQHFKNLKKQCTKYKPQKRPPNSPIAYS